MKITLVVLGFLLILMGIFNFMIGQELTSLYYKINPISNFLLSVFGTGILIIIGFILLGKGELINFN